MAKKDKKTEKKFEVDEEVSVGKISLTDKTRIRCRLNRRGEDISVDLRVWYTTDQLDGEFKPTAKGVSVDVSKIDAMIKMLKKAKEKAEEMGE